MKANDVIAEDRIQVPWSDEPIRITYVGLDWLGRIILRGEQRYTGIWDAHDEVPIVPREVK